MKVAVVCANGKAGKLITAEAVNRGLDVTAVVRGENKTVAEKSLSKDIFDFPSAGFKPPPLGGKRRCFSSSFFLKMVV